MQVLVVDDNAVNRRVAVAMLEKLGQRAHVAVSGGEAVRLARSSAIDVILMDLSMPGIDGHVATRLIRAESGGGRPRIVALTAHDRETSIPSGMDDYLTKPIRVEPLAAALARAASALRDAPAAS